MASPAVPDGRRRANARVCDHGTDRQRNDPVNYPFAFRQRLAMALVGKLHWEQVIENTAIRVPFSTGFHPFAGAAYYQEPARLLCGNPDARRATPQGPGIVTLKPFTARTGAQKVEGNNSFDRSKENELILIDPISELEVVLNFKEAPKHRFVAIWSKSTQMPFYCLEPWTALPNSFGRIKDHELILLEPKTTFRAAMWMELRAMG